MEIGALNLYKCFVHTRNSKVYTIYIVLLATSTFVIFLMQIEILWFFTSLNMKIYWAFSKQFKLCNNKTDNQDQLN